MKKIISYLLVMLMMIPCIVLADYKYDDGVTKTDTYIFTYSDYARYMKVKEGLPYGFSNGKAVSANGFKFGGFITNPEFEITNSGPSTSWLAPGIEYWLIGKNKLDTKVRAGTDEDKSGVRITEYVLHNAQVSGTGSITNPWTFIDGYNVKVGVTDKTIGQISPENGYEHVGEGDGPKEFILTYDNKYALDTRACQNVASSTGATFSIVNGSSANTKKITINNISKDFSCFINFGTNCYAIAFNNNGGTGGIGGQQYYYQYGKGWFSDSICKSALTPSITSPTRVGYTYQGYKYKINETTYGKTIVNASNKLVPGVKDSDVQSDTAYAHWKPIEYTITYDYDGGSAKTGGSYPDKGTFGNVIQVTPPTKVGWTFDGWTATGLTTSTALQGSTNNPTTSWDGTKVKVNYFKNLRSTAGSVTLKAVWKKNYVVIYFSAQNNTTEPLATIKNQIVLANDAHYTDGTVYAHAGDVYNFELRDDTIKINGTNKSFKNIIYWNSPSNRTTRKVIYDVSYGETLYYHGDGLPGLHNCGSFFCLERKYHTYQDKAEWKCASGNCGHDVYNQKLTTYKDTDFCDCSTSSCYIVLEPNWVPAKYKITLNNKSADTAGTAEIYEKAYDGYYLDSALTKKMSSSTNKITKPTKTGNDFLGYFTAETGGTKYIDENGAITSSASNTAFDAAGTLYAHWSATSYTITLTNTNATTAGSTSVTVPYLGTPGAITNPTRQYTITYDKNSTGATLGKTSDTATYTFDGWYTAASGGSKVINANGTLVSNVSGYTNASGKWSKASGATLYAHWSGGSVTVTTVTKDNNTCNFNTKSDGSGTTYNASSSITPTAATILYARCTVSSYTITLTNTNATTNGSTSVTVPYLGTPGAITNPKREYTVTYDKNSTGATLGKTSDKSSYTFDGWYTAASGGSKVINANGTLVSNVSGYTNSSGKWSKTSGATLYAHWTGGSVTVTTITKNNHSCTFNSSSNGSGTNYNPSTSITPTAATILYGICAQSKTITVTFNYNKATWNGTTTTRQCTVNAYGKCSVTSPGISNYTGKNSCINGNCSQQKSLGELFTVRGWNTNSGASTATVTSGGSIEVSSNTTYYAIVSLTKTSVKTFTEGADGVFVRTGPGGTSTGLIPANSWITIGDYSYPGTGSNPLWVKVTGFNGSCSNHGVQSFSTCLNWMSAQWITW